MKATARSLITGECRPMNESPENEAGGPPPRRVMGGPPRRDRQMAGPEGAMGAMGAPDEGGLSPRERATLKDLVILDMLHALNNDPFATRVANVALTGAPITADVARHFMDEAPKYADKMSPAVNALMEKIAQIAV